MNYATNVKPKDSNLFAIGIWVLFVLQILVIAVATSKLIPDSQIFDQFSFKKAIKFATYTFVALNLVLLAQAIRKRKANYQNPWYLVVFLGPALVGISTSAMHYERNALLNMTWIAMITGLLLVWLTIGSKSSALKHVESISLAVSAVSLVVVGLTTFGNIPTLGAIGSPNEGFLGWGFRQSGITFNPGFLGLSQLLVFAVGLNAVKNRKNATPWIGVLTVVFSSMCILSSGSKLSQLSALIVLALIWISRPMSIARARLLSIVAILLILLFGFFAPFVIGSITQNQELATFSGRLDLWKCSLSNWEVYWTTGYGIEGAFKEGFCSELSWSNGWRHAESISITSFRESGIVGPISWFVFFLATLRIGIRDVAKGQPLAIAVSISYFVLGQTGGMLSTYLPIAGLPASRGIFNFYLYLLLWIALLRVATLSQQLYVSSNHRAVGWPRQKSRQ
jgi:hypothetical protein